MTTSQMESHNFKLKCIEYMIGLGFASVSIGLTIFAAVLVKYFEASHDLPTNLVIIRGLLQILLFAMAVFKSHQCILPFTRREKVVVISRGFLTGVLFITNIAALRFLPLGDVFTLLAAKSVFCIFVTSVLYYVYQPLGKPFDTRRICLILVATLGFYLFLCTKSGHTELFNELQTNLVIPVPKFAFFLERTLRENTVVLGLVVAMTNLVLNVPVMYLSKMCEGTSASVQSFWSGVGGFLVGVLSSFWRRETSIFSGSYSAYEMCVVLFISVFFIGIAILQSQATKFISTPALNLIRIVEIPVAYLLCPNEVMPNFYSVMGTLFILSSSVVGDWLMYMEEKDKVDYEEVIDNNECEENEKVDYQEEATDNEYEEI